MTPTPMLSPAQQALWDEALPHLPSDWIGVAALQTTLPTGEIVACDGIWISPTGLVPLALLTEPLSETALRDQVAQLRQSVHQLQTALTHPTLARVLFNDPRLAACLPVQPLLLLPSPDMLAAHPTEIRVLAIEELTSALPTLRLAPAPFELASAEQERLVTWLQKGINPLDHPTTFQHISQPTPPDGDRPAPAPPTSPFKRLWHWVQQAMTVTEKRLGSLEDTMVGSPRLKHEALEKALEDRLDQSLRHLPTLTIAHNHFTLHLAEQDFDEIESYQLKIIQALVHHLDRVILSRDYTLEGPLVVTLIADASVPPGDCWADSVLARDASSPTGTLQAWLVIHQTGETFPLDRPSITLGRHPSCDLSLTALDDPQAPVTSRYHAQIQVEGERFVLYDGVAGTPSSEGTFVQGQRVGSQRWQGHTLRHGDRIILGPPQRVDPTKPMEGSILLIFRINQPGRLI